MNYLITATQVCHTHAMHLHEYQAKQLFSEYGIPVPQGRLLESADEASGLAEVLSGPAWVVKAQIHAGGRGKGGGVRLVDNLQALQQAVRELLGSQLVTPQTDAGGLPVNSVLVEQTVPIAREIYFGMLVDRSRERIGLMVSSSGGMNIEEVATTDPDAIVTESVNPAVGLQGYQCRNLAFALGLSGKQIGSFTRLLQAAYRLLLDTDAGLLEINPLVVTEAGELVALDAKVDLDDNALFRHPQLAELHDASQEDEREYGTATRSELYTSAWQHCLHGQWCRSGDGDHGPDQVTWRHAGQFSGCRWWRNRRQGCRGLQAHPLRSPGGSHTCQYLWRHCAL